MFQVNKINFLLVFKQTSDDFLFEKLILRENSIRFSKLFKRFPKLLNKIMTILRQYFSVYRFLSNFKKKLNNIKRYLQVLKKLNKMCILKDFEKNIGTFKEFRKAFQNFREDLS